MKHREEFIRSIQTESPWFLRQIGDYSKPWLILIHGSFGTGEDWIPIAERLKGESCILMPDLPGCGETGRQKPDHPLTFERIGEELNHLVSLLPPGSKPFLGGYSLGGRIALYTTLHHNLDLAGLYIESANPGISDEKTRQERRELDDTLADRVNRDGLHSFFEFWYKLPLFASIGVDPKRYAEMIEKRVKTNEQPLASALISRLSPGRMPDLWPRLSSLSCPTVVASGVLDEKYEGICREMVQQIPGAEGNSVEGAGHTIHLEQPDRVAELIRELIRKHHG